MAKHLNVQWLRRIPKHGQAEELRFEPGLNLIVGHPNAGKSQWARMLDYLLGDSEPFDQRFAPDISYKYEALEAGLRIGSMTFEIARLLNREGLKTKVMVGSQAFDVHAFQHWLMGQLGIPLVRYPKGLMNVTQSWPELSFRTLYRHMYRQQRFWGDLADKQYLSESNACLLQFLGLADRIFSKNTEQLRALRARSDRSSVEITGSEIAIDTVLAETNPSLASTGSAVSHAQEQLSGLISARRTSLAALLDHVSCVEGAGRKKVLQELVAAALEVGTLSERARILDGLIERRQASETEFEQLAALIADLSQSIYEQDITNLIRERTYFLAQAMNEYMDILNSMSNGFWRHSDIRVRTFRRNELSLCVGPMLWSRALGGTDSLLFLMAYHYGLLALAVREECNYPGFLIVDLPAYFRGEAISHLEAQMTAPFADLLARNAYAGCQAIFIGSAFQGETRGNRIEIRGSHLH